MTLQSQSPIQPLRRRRFKLGIAAAAPRAAARRGFELRSRDLDMIESIARHRFLNTEQVCWLFACDCPWIEKIGQRNGVPQRVWTKTHRPFCACTCTVQNKKGDHAPSCPALFKDDKHVAARLRELFHAGLLDRPIAQLQLRINPRRTRPRKPPQRKADAAGEGSVPMVYSVTARGLEALGEERRRSLGKLSWVEKDNEGGRIFIEHTLAIADISIAIDVALRHRHDLRRVDDTQLKAGMTASRRDAVRPWALKARYKNEELSAVCDLAFALQNTTSAKQWNFLVEADLGSMPVERKDLRQTSIVRKLIAYATAHLEDAHTHAFGWRNFRVLILTTTEERKRACMEAARRWFGTGKSGRLFLFGTLDAAATMLEPAHGSGIVDIDGAPVSLTE
jgi:hypothetical protein